MFRRFQKTVPDDAAGDHSLALAQPGQRLRITGYRGGRILRARLLALALTWARKWKFCKTTAA